MNMKKLIVVSSLLVSGFSSAYAAAKIEECSLYVSSPVITNAPYGQNDGSNQVSSAVLRILQNNGFTIVTNYRRARYVMNTDVKCGKMWVMGYMDVCRTEVEFIDRVEQKVVYTDGPTTATPGLSINFDAIQFPDCTSL